MSRSHYRPYQHVRGRWRLEGDLSNFNRPIISMYAEPSTVIPTPQKGDCWITLSYGNHVTDPVISLELDLVGTLLGRALAWLYWHWPERKHP